MCIFNNNSNKNINYQAEKKKGAQILGLLMCKVKQERAGRPSECLGGQ